VDERKRIRGFFEQALRGEPWHGPSLEAALKGVDAEAAAARSIEDAHSIWEIVLHLTGWTREVARRLEGAEPRPPSAGDWPEAEPADESRWEEARADLSTAHEELLTALDRILPSRLEEIVGGRRDLPLGTGVSYREMILGSLQHDAYHAGQIALLKKRGR
jgi:uncharacterized damage-inducible protein DinB